MQIYFAGFSRLFIKQLNKFRKSVCIEKKGLIDICVHLDVNGIDRGKRIEM